MVLSFLLLVCILISNGKANENLTEAGTQMKEIMIRMENRMLAMELEMKNMKRTHEHEIQTMKDHILPCNISSLQKRMLLPTDAMDKRVAFDALLTQNVDHTGLTDSTIVFDKVLTNIGNAYASDVGIFTSPENGVFLFSLTIHGDYASYIFVALMVNGVRKTTITIDGSANRIYIPSSSRTSLLALNQGDRVYVQIFKNSRGLVKSSDNGHSTFAGALLFTI